MDHVDGNLADFPLDVTTKGIPVGVGRVLAPHGKTPMAPALAQRLVASGCWGISVANLQQTIVFLNTGLQNVILANEGGGARSVAQLVMLASQFPAASLYVFVDSIALIAAFKGSLESVGNLSLLIETGLSGGRNGFRDIQGVEDAAAAMTLGILPPMMLGFFAYPYIGKSMIRGAVKG